MTKEAIDFIQQMQYKQAEIDQLEQELERWKCRATKVTPTYSDMPKGGETSDKIQTAVEEMASIEKKIESKKSDLVKIEVSAMLKGINLKGRKNK